MAKKGGVVIKVHSKHLTAQRLQQVFERGALPELAQEMLQNCNEYCPQREGTLMESGHIEDGGKYLVWDTKYAAKVYYTSTQNISKQKNPKAAARWCEVAERKYSKHWAEKATELVQGK
jgi:hypothetical protein